MPFPKEQPIDQHDLISAAENDLFNQFDEELGNSATVSPINQSSLTRSDFDFTEVPLPGQPARGGQSHVIARPKSGQGPVWGFEPRQTNWYEDITVDSRGDMLDISGAKVGQAPGPTHVPGTCPSCGAATQLPGGSTAAFCPSCGTPQAAHIQVIPAGAVPFPGVQQPGMVPMPPPPGVPNHPPPVNNGIRMVGNEKPPPVIPPGLGKSDDKGDFDAFLEAAIAAGQEKTDEGPSIDPITDS
jgi:hypothetical protein